MKWTYNLSSLCLLLAAIHKAAAAQNVAAGRLQLDQ